MRKEGNYISLKDEYDTYTSIAGNIMRAGNGAIPQATFVASYIQKTYTSGALLNQSEQNSKVG